MLLALVDLIFLLKKKGGGWRVREGNGMGIGMGRCWELPSPLPGGGGGLPGATKRVKLGGCRALWERETRGKCGEGEFIHRLHWCRGQCS